MIEKALAIRYGFDRWGLMKAFCSFWIFTRIAMREDTERMGQRVEFAETKVKRS